MLSDAAKKKQYESQRRIHSDTLDRVTIWVPKGKKETYKEYAKSMGVSLNQLVVDLLENEMKK